MITDRAAADAVPVRSLDRRGVSFWGNFAVILALGYFCMGRSFAYLGVPADGLFIGEVSLALFLVLGPGMRGGWRWVAIRARRLRRVELLIVTSLVYGGIEGLRGVSAGYGTLGALRGTAFNYYALFLFWGVWAGLRDGGLLSRLARALAWCNGIYGAAYVLFLNRLPWMMPGTSGAPSIVPLFSAGWASAAVLLGLLAFESELRRVWHLIALNSLVLLGLEIRGEWVGLAVGLLVFVFCTKRLKRLESVVIAGAALVVVLVLSSIANFSLPGVTGRGGGRISVNYFVARVTAPLDRHLADSFAPDENVRTFAANADWRVNLWSSVWDAVNESPSRALFGLGYGYPMWNFVERDTSNAPLQSTHNDFIYALGFSGWIGVVIFVLLQLEIAKLLFRAFKVTGEPFGLMAWSALLTFSMFESYFESPFGAIPFYLLIGIALAPALFSQRSASESRDRLRHAPRLGTELALRSEAAWPAAPNASLRSFRSR
jgi:hypothetical protein